MCSPAPVSLYYEAPDRRHRCDVEGARAGTAAVPVRRPPAKRRRPHSFPACIPTPETSSSWANPWSGAGAHPGVWTATTGSFCCGNGETFNVPVELFESRYGSAGRAVRLQHGRWRCRGKYRGRPRGSCSITGVTSEGGLSHLCGQSHGKQAVGAGRRCGGQHQLRADPARRRSGRPIRQCAHTVRAKKGEVIRLTTANGRRGYGDPAARDRSAIEQDVLNGYVHAGTGAGGVRPEHLSGSRPIRRGEGGPGPSDAQGNPGLRTYALDYRGARLPDTGSVYVGNHSALADRGHG